MRFASTESIDLQTNRHASTLVIRHHASQPEPNQTDSNIQCKL